MSLQVENLKQMLVTQQLLTQTMEKISKIAPWVNLVAPVLIMLFLGYFHYYHIQSVLQDIGYVSSMILGISFWIIVATSRIAALISTVADFARHDYIEGVFGLAASVVLLLFDLWLLGKIGESHFQTNQEFFVYCFRTLSVVATVLEGRLVLLLLNSSEAKIARQIRELEAKEKVIEEDYKARDIDDEDEPVARGPFDFFKRKTKAS